MRQFLNLELNMKQQGHTKSFVTKVINKRQTF